MLSSQIDALRVQGGMRERFDDVTLSPDPPVMIRHR